VAAFVLTAAWIACAHASGVARVSNTPSHGALSLQPALESDAEPIVLDGNYYIEDEFDEFLNKPLRINR
jgi:hypothetical protein